MTRTVTLLTLLLAAGGASAADPPAVKRPNVVIVLTDDQGYGDLSCHGNPVLKTPNIDRLHREGVRFTDFHVSPTCSLTRSALLTGRYEFKNGVMHTMYERERLTPKATTLAEVRRGVRPRGRRHRPDLPRQLRRRPRQHPLRPRDPAQRPVRQDEGLLHRPVVSAGKGLKRWRLFDVSADPGEKTNVAAGHPGVVTKLDAEYDVWWASRPPFLVNEAAVGPAENPFKALYRAQFGGRQ